MYLEEKLASLKLPPLKTREEMLFTLQKEEYGFLPPAPDSLSVESDEVIVPRFNGGKAPLHKAALKCALPCGDFVFPFTYAVPVTEKKKYPAIIQLSFSDIYHKYQPTEEILDNGFAIFTVDYQDVAPDKDDGFLGGISALLYKDGKRKPDDPGKLAMWAWAAQRIMDFLETRDDIDLSRVSVAGHSRLGKTALLCAATDERFFCACSSAAGTSGDAISRGKQGETVKDIVDRFPYWFCENYYKYSGKEKDMPFDQHWLIASVAPRYVYICSESEDLWADPEFEHLSCAAAAPAFKRGFITPDRAPRIGDFLDDGDIGFHLRWGDHYFCREDWLHFLDFLKSKG